MKYCILNALYWEKSNLNSKTYIKNTIVSLATIKGRDVDKLLITNNINFADEYLELISFYNIKIIECPFDNFLFPKGTPWQFGYYKICALNYIVRNYQYEKYLLIDTDTISIRPYDEIFWDDIENVCLYYLPMSLSYRDRKTFIHEMRRFNNIKNPKYFGGEFIGGNRESLIEYLDKCFDIYLRMKKVNFISTRGDEFIWSLAACSLTRIDFGNPYILRVAVTMNYYSAETRYVYDDVRLLHVLCEKETGLIYIYNKFIKKHKMPSISKLRKIFGLPKAKRSIFDTTSYHLLSYIKKAFMKKGKIYE